EVRDADGEPMSRTPGRRTSLSSPADTRLPSPAAFPGGRRQGLGSLGWLGRLELQHHALWGGPRAGARCALAGGNPFFHAWPILFVGFGLVDDNFESLFAQVRALAGDHPPRHFALMPQGALQGIRRSRAEQAGVRLIEYPNLDGRHADVARILEWLASGDPTRFPEAAPAPTP
ncbi:MAG: SIR2 family protein, partial [Myxococcaceae bacterium]|nr:SIR2 family protein [Myxococcaceae bacterium]